MGAANHDQPMKRILSRAAVAGLIALLATSVGGLYAQSQADQIKKKAKDFKKQVEGQQPAKTNAPVQKPKQAPQKPAR